MIIIYWMAFMDWVLIHFSKQGNPYCGFLKGLVLGYWYSFDMSCLYIITIHQHLALLIQRKKIFILDFFFIINGHFILPVVEFPFCFLSRKQRYNAINIWFINSELLCKVITTYIDNCIKKFNILKIFNNIRPLIILNDSKWAFY